MAGCAKKGGSRQGAERCRTPSDAGYTLAEVLIVLVIIALIVGLATPALMGRLGAAQSRTAEIQLENLATSLDLFRLDIGRYPTTEEGLAALVAPAPALEARWAGPYVRRGELPADPWGRPYIYRPASGGGFELVSYGRDGEPGGTGEDRDIVIVLER
ncbi:type II secretion system major pseudopilin GspG [Glycocaulis abyssi]|uniref:Type II secretion system core protein G n=1 Tax=Glycocaulis abyssi TaxID=1433403 RepID=A0ABV9NHS0_9PROT